MIADGRQGFAYAGTLDDDVLAETLAEARDNAGFATPDEFLGLAEPDGVAVADLDLFSDELDVVPHRRQGRRWPSSSSGPCGPPTRASPASSRPSTSTSMAEGAIVTTTGIRTPGRETACYVVGLRLATEGDETQTGFGFSVGREPGELDVEVAAADAAGRATRLLGAVKPPSERLTVVLDPWVTAQFLGILGYTLNGEAVLKGRSLFADRLGEEVASPLVTLVDDPTNPLAFTATETDGEGLATRRNLLVDGGVLAMFVHNAYTARRAGTRSTGSAVRSGFKGTPAVGCLAPRCCPARPRRPSSSPAWATACSCRTLPGCTRGSTRSAATSPPAPKGSASAAASWPSRCASSPSPPPCRGCSRTSARSAATSSGCR